jgi:hypothetical protein
MLDSLSCSFTSMSFLTNELYLAVSDYIMREICLFQLKFKWDCRDRMVVGFITTYAISAIHH